MLSEIPDRIQKQLSFSIIHIVLTLSMFLFRDHSTILPLGVALYTADCAPVPYNARMHTWTRTHVCMQTYKQTYLQRVRDICAGEHDGGKRTCRDAAKRRHDTVHAASWCMHRHGACIAMVHAACTIPVHAAS